jgi:hypothetical protein
VAILVILVLVVLWAAVLIPPILRSRHSSGHGGVSDFMDGLRSLGSRHHHAKGPSLGGPVLHGPVIGPPSSVRNPRQPIAPPMAYRPMPGGISPMQRRRRNVLMALTGAVGLSFLMALVARSMMFFLLFVITVAALGAYCYLLVQMKHRTLSMRAAPPKRTYVTPVEMEDDSPKVGDNVIVLRRNVG